MQKTINMSTGYIKAYQPSNMLPSYLTCNFQRPIFGVLHLHNDHTAKSKIMDALTGGLFLVATETILLESLFSLW